MRTTNRTSPCGADHPTNPTAGFPHPKLRKTGAIWGAPVVGTQADGRGEPASPLFCCRLAHDLFRCWFSTYCQAHDRPGEASRKMHRNATWTSLLNAFDFLF